ncbi:glycoside hydrolase family 32 protein [Aeoliella mucimassa]|nr:glycoside hydrolase family 32 protein [Aeoliella mucimassa]
MKFSIATATLVSLALLSLSPSYAEEPLFENSGFESGTLHNWTPEGEAFAVQPTKGDNPSLRGRESSWHEGEYWVGGYEAYTKDSGTPGQTRGDQFTGTLTSTEFVIQQPYLSFLISGGKQPGKLGVKLVCGDIERELATGCDSETLRRCNAEVSDLVGRRAKLVIYDNSTGQWGHLNADAFVGSAEPLADESQAFAFSKLVRAELYDDINYSEPLRPQFHFTSGRNWINDPNGMVFNGQQYHLFFQHNPASTEWGNMTWGHATSPDMIHWTQHPHALLPYRIDGQAGTVFSGTAIIDHNNSLGKQQGDTPTMCAFFTFACEPRFYQALAYSTDLGHTWTYWNEGRPVVENQGFDAGERDPKVFWHEPSQKWVMALWVQQNPGRVRFFTSTNLTEWTFASDLMRDWAFECMDLITLPVDGDPAKTKVVLYDASFDYEVGQFDGKTFHTEAGPFVAGGGDFYAAQTFNNHPTGRAVQIGWMRGGPNPERVYQLPFNGQMSFPCDLTLHTHNNQPRLHAWPVAEIASLVDTTLEFSDVTLSPGDNLLEQVEKLDLVDLEIDFAPEASSELVLDLGRATVRYDATSQKLYLPAVDGEGHAREVVAFENLKPRDGSIRLRLLVDRLSVEAFVFDGERFYASYYNPTVGDDAVSITSQHGTTTIRSLKLNQLHSAWPSTKR